MFTAIGNFFFNLTHILYVRLTAGTWDAPTGLLIYHVGGNTTAVTDPAEIKAIMSLLGKTTPVTEPHA